MQVAGEAFYLIFLPGEDGCSLIRQIRMSSCIATRQIPAIALTACRSDLLCEQVIEAGFDSYHEKPVLPEDLAAIINALVCYNKQRPSELYSVL